MRLSGAFWWLIAILIAIQPMRVKAHDHERPDLEDWYKSLRSRGGGNCCDGSDAFSVLDPEWERTNDPENPFRVKFKGVWLTVAKRNVVNEVNRAGIAKVWPAPETDSSGQVVSYYARCFLPGSES